MSRRSWAGDLASILLLTVWVVASRLPYVNDFAAMGKDGPLYIHSLALDAAYDVPMPGNIGFVLLGKVALEIWSHPVHAYAAVTILLSALGAAFCYLCATLVVPRPLAAAAAFALTANAQVWWHGDVIASYPAWLAVLPAIGWFGGRYVLRRRLADLVGASVALGLGMILRQDLLAFGTPLWLGCLALGRAPWRGWLIGGAIVLAACAGWFFGTAAVLGGVGVYLERVGAKHAGDLHGFSVFHRGLFEGLVRNGSKYALFLAWAAHLVLLPFLAGVAGAVRAARRTWPVLLLGLLWVGPSWYFSLVIFAGNAGLIFPFLPLVYIGAAYGLRRWFGDCRRWPPVAVLVLLGLVSVAQFAGAPLLREIHQRDVILNVMFLKYSGAGLRARYNYNLDDYGVAPALASVVRQLRAPEPIPAVPPAN